MTLHCVDDTFSIVDELVNFVIQILSNTIIVSAIWFGACIVYTMRRSVRVKHHTTPHNIRDSIFKKEVKRLSICTIFLGIKFFMLNMDPKLRPRKRGNSLYILRHVYRVIAVLIRIIHLLLQRFFERKKRWNGCGQWMFVNVPLLLNDCQRKK